MAELRLSMVLTADGKGLRADIEADKKAVMDFAATAAKAGESAGKGLGQAEGGAKKAATANKAVTGSLKEVLGQLSPLSQKLSANSAILQQQSSAARASYKALVDLRGGFSLAQREIAGFTAAAATIKGELAKLQSAAATASTQLANAFKGAEGGATRTAIATAGIGAQIRTLIATLATGFAVKEIIQTADSWKLVEARLRLVTSSTQELKSVQEALFNSAQKARQSFESTSDLYSRIARNAKTLGASQQDILTVTEAVNQGFVVSGASAQESAAAVLQFGQALSSGTLQGDELRSVLENAPRLAQAISDGLGVSVGELRKLGAAGELTAKQIFDALLKTAPQIASEFSKVPVTVGQSLIQIGNSLKRLVGFSDEATGASAVLANAFSDLARRLAQPEAIAAATQLAEGVAAALRGLVDVAIFAGQHIEALGVAFGALAGAKIAAGAITTLTSVLGLATTGLRGLAIAAGIADAALLPIVAPIIAIAAVVGGLTAAWIAWADEIQPVNGSLATLQDYADAAWQTLKGFAGTISEALLPAFHALGPIASAAWETIKQALISVREIYKAYHNFVVNSFQALFTLPPVFARVVVASFRDGFGVAKEISSAFFADLANAFSGDFGFANFKATLGKDLFAGVTEAASEASRAISNVYSQDQIGNALNVIDSIGTQWKSSAEAIAENRRESELLAGKFKALEPPAKQSLGAVVSGASKASEALSEARARVDELFRAGQDLAAQRDAIKGGNIADLYNIQDLQKARDTLLQFGEEAKIKSRDVNVLAKAYGKTLGDIANELGNQRELQKEINDFTEQSKAPEKIKDYLEDLDRQNEKLQLEIAGRKDLIALIEAQNQLEDNIDRTLTGEELNQLREKIALNASLNKTLEARKEAEEAAKKNAELLAEPFKNAIRGIQDSFTGLFRNLFTGGVKNFKSLGKNIKNIFVELASQLATLLVFRPVLNFVLGGNSNALGLGGSSAQGGTGGGLFDSIGKLFGGGQSGGGGLDFGKVLSGDFGGLFKGSILGNAFGGSAPKFIGGAGSGAANFSGLSGLFSGLNFGGAALAGGLAGLPALLKGDFKGGAISGGLGLVGSLIGGPIGGIIGGLAGNLLGGLFGKKKKAKKYRSIADIGVDRYGYLDVTDIRTNKRGSREVAQQLGDQTTGAVNSLLDELGASFLPDIGGFVKAYSKKKGKKKKPTQYSGEFGGILVESTTNLEEFIGDYATTALAIGSQRNKLEGVTDTQKTIFNTLFQNNNKSLDTLKEGIAFSRFYDRTDEARTPAIAAADAIRKLTVEMRNAQSQAEEFGLSVDRVKEVFKLNFEEDIANELLQLKDPGAYALQELGKEYQARKAVAEKLGADITQLEELYGLKRKQAIEENLNAGLTGIKNRLQEWVRSLTQGDLTALSPTQRFEQAKKDFSEATTKGDAEALQETGQTLLQVAREFYGSGVKYAEIFREVLKAAGNLGGFKIDIPGFASGGLHSGGARIVGEKGPELELTGAARYLSNSQTIDLLRQAGNDNNRFVKFPDIAARFNAPSTNSEIIARAIRDQEAAQAERDREMLTALKAKNQEQAKQIRAARLARSRDEIENLYGRKAS